MSPTCCAGRGGGGVEAIDGGVAGWGHCGVKLAPSI